MFSTKTSDVDDIKIANIGRIGNNGSPSEVNPAPDPEWRLLLKALLDRRKYPVCVLRPDMRVYAANEAAKHSAGLGLTVAQNAKFCFERVSENRRFAEVTRKISRSVEQDHFGPHLMRYETLDGIARIIALSPFSLPLEPETASLPQIAQKWLLVSINSAPGVVQIHPDRIASALDLTRCEASLAAALAGGVSLQSYASRENVKISTVRWHLKNIYERTGARSQGQLIGMITALLIH